MNILIDNSDIIKQLILAFLPERENIIVISKGLMWFYLGVYPHLYLYILLFIFSLE